MCLSFLRKQESRYLLPPKSPSPGLAKGQAGLSTARGEASWVPACAGMLGGALTRRGRGDLFHSPTVLPFALHGPVRPAW